MSLSERMQCEKHAESKAGMVTPQELSAFPGGRHVRTVRHAKSPVSAGLGVMSSANPARSGPPLRREGRLRFAVDFLP
jgi:hypothetical protein